MDHWHVDDSVRLWLWWCVCLRDIRTEAYRREVRALGWSPEHAVDRAYRKAKRSDGQRKARARAQIKAEHQLDILRWAERG